VAVNLVGPQGTVRFFDADSLEGALRDAPGQLTVQMMPLDAYRSVVTGKLRGMMSAASALRGSLRERPAGDCAEGIRALVAGILQAAAIVGALAFQRSSDELHTHAQAIHRLAAQLAASAFEHADNVRCMDDLHYEIVPRLTAAAEAMSRVR
jgi:hypothetical protein